MNVLVLHVSMVVPVLMVKISSHVTVILDGLATDAKLVSIKKGYLGKIMNQKLYRPSIATSWIEFNYISKVFPLKNTSVYFFQMSMEVLVSHVKMVVPVLMMRINMSVSAWVY